MKNLELLISAKKQARIQSKKEKISLKDALEKLAIENGFEHWKAYKNSLDTFWYEKMSAFLNHWFAQYAEAKSYQKQFGGYLLTYKGQYFICQSEYIAALGFDPNADIWKAVSYDLSSANAIDRFYEFYRKIPAKAQI